MRALRRVGEHDRLYGAGPGVRVGEGLAGRLRRQVAEGAIQESAEAGHADADDAGLPHGESPPCGVLVCPTFL